jgi:hypothetical protein
LNDNFFHHAARDTMTHNTLNNDKPRIDTISKMNLIHRVCVTSNVGAITCNITKVDGGALFVLSKTHVG